MSVDKVFKQTTHAGSLDLPLLFLNIFLFIAVGAVLFFVSTSLQRQTVDTALKDNLFLTTEWRLLQEMKSRTDRLLEEKDKEIAELRERYEVLQLKNDSSEALALLEEQIRRAEAERASIVALRYSSPSSTDTALAAADLPSVLPVDLAPAGESPVVVLLRQKIQDLENQVLDDARSTEDLEAEIAALKQSMNVVQKLEPPPPSAPAGASADINLVLDLLEKDLAALQDLEPVLSVADVRTRSLLRAIVRTPAIKSEYPELVDSLDRYFELYGTTERLNGKREAYEEIIGSLEEMGD